MSTRSVAKKIFDFSLLRRVLKFASPYKRRFFISLTLAIILALFSPIRPYLIQLTVNDYIKGGVNGSGAGENENGTTADLDYCYPDCVAAR